MAPRSRPVVDPPLTTDVVVMPDGRELEYAEFGDADGRPVIWLHGTPGSCRQVAPAAKAAAVAQGLRVIGVARPGVGRSTPAPHDRIVDVARDLVTLADRLRLDRYAVIGLSGGGPYSLALGHLDAHRVVGVAVLGGVPPFVGPDAATGGLVALAPRFGWLTRRVEAPAAWAGTRLLRPLIPWGSQIYDAFSLIMPQADRDVFATPGVKDMFIDDLARGVRGHGLQAAMRDAVLFGRDWGFRLADVDVPVRWWHGDKDTIIPLAHGRHAAGLLPNATFVLRPGGSHLSGYAAADDVVQAISEFFV